MKKASILLHEIMGNSLRQRRFIYHTLFNKWTEIIGDDMSVVMTPVRLKFSRRNDGAILTIRISSALGPQIQLQVENIMKRINHFYGSIAVKAIKLEVNNDLNLLRSFDEDNHKKNSKHNSRTEKMSIDQRPKIDIDVADPELKSILQILKRNWFKKKQKCNK